MGGFQLMALFADMATGNSGETEVLEATCCDNGEQPVRHRRPRKQDAVDKLLNGG